MLPAAASNATSGRESMTCMAFRQDFSIEVGWGVQTCRIVSSEAIYGIGTRKRRKVFFSHTAYKSAIVYSDVLKVCYIFWMLQFVDVNLCAKQEKL